LNDAIRPYARTAYAQGWAQSGGPMSQRVQAGCLVAMDICAENWDSPGVLEVAIHLGRLEGVWARVFARRFAAMEDYTVRVRKVWRSAVADFDVRGAVALYRQALGLSETAEDPDWVRRAKREARDAAMRLLAWMPGTDSWQKLRDLMREVIRTARAEGYVDALAAASTAEQHLNFAWDIAFRHAYDALENDTALWAESDTWLNRMLGRSADEFGLTLGNLAAQGADYSQMLAAAVDVLQDTVEERDTVGFIVDWAMSFGMSKGALDLYASEGVRNVTWMTAGDGRVCPTCERYGEESPYPIMDFPSMPAHPLCRCVASAEIDTSAFSGFSS
jgi:hypothetical protein